jgi:putative transposase
VREQFLVELTDTTAEELAAAGTDHRTALLELNRLLTAWIETEYHRRIHSETGQTPLERWDTGWSRVGRTPSMPTAPDLTEAFLWSEYRTVTRTATVSLHGNTFQVDTGLVGRKVELVFSPFDLETVEVRYRDTSYGKALPHNITRHVHPKARAETPEPPTPPATGIDTVAMPTTPSPRRPRPCPLRGQGHEKVCFAMNLKEDQCYLIDISAKTVNHMA